VATAYEHITTSDHIRFEPFTHAAFTKGDLVSIGGITGIADINFAANDAVEIDCGVPRAVYRVVTSDITGTPAVGANVYITAAGALTMTATDNTLYGVITDIAGAVSFVKVGL
jgi:hypothetical protein